MLDGFEAARDSYEGRGGIIATLQARSSQVAFKDLYTAVLALQATEGDHCPACDTPLTGQIHVTVNPYTKAAEGLAELKKLGEASLRYTGIESHEGLAHYGLYDTVVAKD